MDPIESLNMLAGILQQIPLPMVANNGQMSHNVVGQHIANIHQAMQAKADGSLKEFNDWCDELYTLSSMDIEKRSIAEKAASARECVSKFLSDRGK